MTNNSICIVYDKVAKAYTAPMAFNNVDCAVRYFNSLMINEGDNATDYELYEIAAFSPDTGVLSNVKMDLIKKGEVVKEVIANVKE
ncbi:nonstructural protein [Capybara microvirus Cap3_SP_478]|nr:nonstructural protein [Capybara microvirus Cap3_SP_478]